MTTTVSFSCRCQVVPEIKSLFDKTNLCFYKLYSTLLEGRVEHFKIQGIYIAQLSVDIVRKSICKLLK